MRRVDAAELLEDPSLPQEVVDDAYRNLAATQRFLGNHRAVFNLLRTSPAPVRKVLDIGCGQGALLREIHEKLGLDVVGFDLRAAPDTGVEILTGDATRDPLPEADVAYTLCVAHHLTETQIADLIRNVAKSSPRLILIDLVRHWIPLTLFRVFVAPFLHRINASDGKTSIRRAYTARELREIAVKAAPGARVEQTVTRFRSRQVVDIWF
jgi:2-polyprenyl-3-methyl-5-hydroxy-6-metoxy-1,4-benzoquinol methylase